MYGIYHEYGGLVAIYDDKAEAAAEMEARAEADAEDAIWSGEPEWASVKRYRELHQLCAALYSMREVEA